MALKWEECKDDIVLILTHACPMACVYCLVRRGGPSMSWELARLAIDILMRDARREPEVCYLGGEPLLRFELIQSAMRYVEENENPSLPVHHCVMTNGLLLDEKKLAWLKGRDVSVSVSIDGSAAAHRRYRPRRDGGDSYRRLASNYAALRRSGLSHGVSMVVTPRSLREAPRNLAALRALGVEGVEICYQVGVEWSDADKDGFLGLLRETGRGRHGVELLNFKRGYFYLLLRNDVTLDVDGNAYTAAAFFLEGRFPRFKEALCLGRLHRGRRLSDMQRSPDEVLALVRRSYPPGSREQRLIDNNLEIEHGMSAAAEECAREVAARVLAADQPGAAGLRPGV